MSVISDDVYIYILKLGDLIEKEQKGCRKYRGIIDQLIPDKVNLKDCKKQ